MKGDFYACGRRSAGVNMTWDPRSSDFASRNYRCSRDCP